MIADAVNSDVLLKLPVLVTGAQGFIGSHLVRKLITTGADVHAVSRVAWPETESPIRTWTCDLRDTEETDRLVRLVQPGVIFHLASQVAGGRDLGLVLPMLDANLQTAVNVLTAAARHGGPRVVLAGSMEEPKPGEKATPSSPYAASKWAATTYAQMFHGLWGLPTVVARIAMVYGPEQLDVRKLVPYVITSLLAGRTPELSSGGREIDWIFIDDVVDALVAAGHTSDAPGAVLDIGSGVPLTIRRTVEMISEIVGSTLSIQFGAVEDRRFDSARIAEERDTAAVLQWTPRVDLREGLTRTVEWYRNCRT